MVRPDIITVFEHQNLRFDDPGMSMEKLEALHKFYKDGKDFPYYRPIHKGVRFNSWVGVLQVGDVQIEVLPKADKDTLKDKDHRRQILIGMLIAVGDLDAKAPSSSALTLHANSILELYFAIYLKELDYLLHRGLVKKYRKVEGNVGALKGALVFGKHIQQNLTHGERFYTRHTVYDRTHKLHQILFKALCAVSRLNHSTNLRGKIAEILLHFPEMPDLKVDATTFERIVLDRKTQSYKTALGIAKLILLHYHPDIRNGKNDVLALMMDMNQLWERFVYVSLRRRLPAGWHVREQVYKRFWESEDGGYVGMKPDIHIYNEKDGRHFVLDTKWKNIGWSNPSPVDLRQLYAYHAYFDAEKVALVYPGVGDDAKHGQYALTKDQKQAWTCSVVILGAAKSGEAAGIRTWQEGIRNRIFSWIDPSLVVKASNINTITDPA